MAFLSQGCSKSPLVSLIILLSLIPCSSLTEKKEKNIYTFILFYGKVEILTIHYITNKEIKKSKSMVLKLELLLL